MTRRLTLVLSGVLVGAAALAQGTESLKGADLELLRDVREIAARVERARGQSFDRPPIAIRAPAEIRETAAEIRALKLLPRDRLAARGRAWADLGLGSETTPFTLYRTLAADLAGVGFDPTANRLLVDPGRLTVEDFTPSDDPADSATVLMETGVRVDEPVVAHMLMHVRQIERQGSDWLGETTDSMLARSAMAEGEANLLAIRLLFQGMGIADGILEERLDPSYVLEGALVPPDLERQAAVEREFLRFVYQEGFAVAVAHGRAGGWPAVDALIAAVATTRDLIHPDRPRVDTAPFAEPTIDGVEGLVAVDADSLGEHAVFVLVSVLTGKDNLGLIAGDGWQGDRLTRLERPGADTTGATVWQTRWGSETAADDFAYSLWRTLEARYPGVAPRDDGEGRRVLDAGDRRFTVRRLGLEVVLEVLPAEWAPPPPAPTGDKGP